MAEGTAGSPARLQGELAVSRAIGDAPYRQYGLIPDPELKWLNATSADRWLVLASDGVFETVSAEMLCRVAGATEAGRAMQWPPQATYFQFQ